jgi:hypothetical protein
VGPVAIAFGVAVACTLLTTVFIRRRLVRMDAFAMAVMLTMAWALSKAIVRELGPDAMDAAAPLTDCAQVIAAMWIWCIRPAPWKLALALVIVGKLALHVLYAGGHGIDPWHYRLLLNGAYAIELLTVASLGGGSIASSVVRRLSLYRAGSDRPVFARGRQGS